MTHRTNGTVRTGCGLWTALVIALLTGVAMVGMSGGALAAGGVGEPVDPFVYRLMVFVMAIFVGYYVVWSVTPALHTPLMSVTNAISSVIVVGALMAVGVSSVMEGAIIAKVFGFLALTMASVNIFGGFRDVQEEGRQEVRANWEHQFPGALFLALFNEQL